MPYLICSNCKSYYKIHHGDFLKDFKGNCDCGGTVRYADNIDFVGSEWKYVNMSNKCSSCGFENLYNSKFCSECGYNLHNKSTNTNNTYSASEPSNDNKINLMTCPDCSHRISKKADVCPNCGLKLKKARNISPGVAFFLGLFIGPFGYIYLERWKELILGVIIGIILFSLFSYLATIFLAVLFALSQYVIAKEMKQEYENRFR